MTQPVGTVPVTTTTTSGSPTITSVTPSVVAYPQQAGTPATQAIQAPAGTEPASAPTTAQTATQGDGKKSLADLIAALPDDDQKVILGEVTKARTEAKNYRTQLREADPAKVRADVLTEITKALGQEQTPPDPAALVQQVAEQQSRAVQAQRELAVFRAAATANADPNLLLDSVTFMRTLADVDPTDSNAVTEAIKAAVAANPSLNGQPVRRLPGHNPALGSSAGGSPDLEALIADAQKRGDLMQVISLQNQKLAAQPQR
jgi:hypothetical protein